MKAEAHQLDHEPVLLQQVLSFLSPKPNETYLDLTAGYGGHAEAVRFMTDNAPAVLVDRDNMAVTFLQKRFVDKNVTIMQSDFLSASQKLAEQGNKYDLILADIGVSSPHLNIASRGFAIKYDGPLDMRMDQSQSLTAETIVNSYSEDDLIRILKQYGEEPRARSIAKAIIAARPIHTTSQLADIVAKQFRGYHKVHPATRTFQGLRIAVNDELMQLEKAIPIWVSLLKPGGRLGIISFHSLEDRIVKKAFTERSGDRFDAELSVLTKRPETADKNELVFNPRSRSAKLRVAAKIKK
ncbi:MAG: 16S rRNA (cytosine(1402)-N(4))-methyltransferase RsmH [Candidatus Saccharibacteria bacterium]|jgi:16S rRNA (cytosine1402-N4)-methyltransferase|nr:16S rRNA (cytosine(1402)-N(4))-methyltransferase RsmH [Candidatus Saccharibacteria bacterium]